MTQFGYAGRILRVDLTTGRTDTIPSAPYTEGFLGGRGIAARFYWETVPPGTGAFDAGNTLVYATGPVTGFITIPGGSRWQICGKSPLAEPEFFSYANLGEKWGTYLKSAGYDALTIRGSAESPVYVHVTEDSAAVKDARHLWGKSAFEAADALKAELGKETSVLTIGTAAENLIPFATMLTDDGSSGASGFGAVMGAKKLKAIAVSAGRFRPTAARPERLEELTHWIIRMRRDTWKDWFENIPGKTRDRACYGCPSGCFRKAYSEGGRRYKFFCQAVHVYWKHALKSSGGADTGTLAIRLCDRYGLDTTIMEPMIDWLLLCHREGIISERETGIPFGEIGGARFIETLTRMIARREGFGAVLAQGTRKAAAALGREAERLLSATAITRAAETRDYDPRLIPTNALLYATEPRRPIHQIHEVSHALWLWRNWANGEKVGFLSYRDLV
ncbi:MAG: hypothetical protein N2506_00190, partial [Dehalococcoidales bacterium]|nr:hypothetical protein [Dehalococcoidales bacterium]